MKPTLFILLIFPFMISATQPVKFYRKLTTYCINASKQFDRIDDERKALLDDLALYIYEKNHSGMRVNLTFICTHNSRRSHMAQLWGLAAAKYYGIDSVHCFSGGTEATAFHPNAIAAMERAGFRITKSVLGPNPVYQAHWGPGEPSLNMFSKKYDDKANPPSGFAAVMVCSDADKNCPFVQGAETRIAIPYEDPKAFDDSPSAKTMYDERCEQIAIELLYTMHQVKDHQIKGK